MKRLVFLLSLVVVIVGVGFYRGWFTVNPEKIERDEELAKEEVREILHDVKAKADKRATRETVPK